MTKKQEKGPALTVVATFAPPASGTRECRRLNEWLNMQHCGSVDPPVIGQVSQAHSDAAWDMHKSRHCSIGLVMQVDGSYVPVSLRVDGVDYCVSPLGALDAAETRIAELERDAEFACQEPAVDCDCAGCRAADAAAERGDL